MLGEKLEFETAHNKIQPNWIVKGQTVYSSGVPGGYAEHYPTEPPPERTSCLHAYVFSPLQSGFEDEARA